MPAENEGLLRSTSLCRRLINAGDQPPSGRGTVAGGRSELDNRADRDPAQAVRKSNDHQVGGPPRRCPDRFGFEPALSARRAVICEPYVASCIGGSAILVATAPVGFRSPRLRSLGRRRDPGGNVATTHVRVGFCRPQYPRCFKEAARRIPRALCPGKSRSHPCTEAGLRRPYRAARATRPRPSEKDPGQDAPTQP